MIQTGKNITSANDPLKKAEVFDLYQCVTKPPDGLRSLLQQLRTISTLDQKKYRKLKTQLPYFVCGIFKPAYRRTSNFASILYFVLDIDHLSDKEITPIQLKMKLSDDERIALMFTSPGGDGIKIMFKLKQKCFDAVKYSMFYKLFAKSFSEQFELNQVIDTRTSDVTRACFLSHDKEAYYNENPITVEMEKYIDFEDAIAVKSAQKTITSIDKTSPKETEIPSEREPSDDALELIKQKLGTKSRKKPDKIIHTPKELNRVETLVTEKATELGLQIKEIRNIHYGKKFIFALDIRWAELNVFYGKKGFSVIKSPKRGSNPELAKVVHTMVSDLLL